MKMFRVNKMLPKGINDGMLLTLFVEYRDIMREFYR